MKKREFQERLTNKKKAMSREEQKERQSDIDIYIRRLKEVRKINPELRLGQIIWNAVDVNKLYYLSDKDLIRSIESTKAN